MGRPKRPDETVQQILETSQRLFLEKGYEHTTVQDIVDNLDGLSRGAVYHHFKSKEEIANAVTRNLGRGQSPDIPSQKGASALEKMKAMVIGSMRQEDIQQVFVTPEALLKNPKFLSNHLNTCFQYAIPQLAALLQQGNEDGSMQVQDIPATAEMLTVLLNLWCVPSILPTTGQQFIARFQLLRVQAAAAGVPFIDDDVIAACKEHAQKWLE